MQCAMREHHGFNGNTKRKAIRYRMILPVSATGTAAHDLRNFGGGEGASKTAVPPTTTPTSSPTKNPPTKMRAY